MSRISNNRKAAYYVGIAMIVIGIVLFLSVFVVTFGMMSDKNDFSMNRMPPFKNAVIGMILMIAGSAISNIGAKGAAGSGLILEPDQAREDLKPFNEAKGKMINDLIGNIDLVDKFVETKEEKEIIKIKCRSCSCLNDEDAKFCKNCGQTI